LLPDKFKGNQVEDKNYFPLHAALCLPTDELAARLNRINYFPE